MMHERRTGDPKKSVVAIIGGTVHVGNLDVPLDAAVEYMRGIPEEKWEAAFVHAVQVGMTEIIARRRRFEMGAQRPPVKAAVSTASIAVVPRAEAKARAEAPRAEEKTIQPPVTLPPEPRMETVEAVASEPRPDVVKPSPEPEGWLRRLDDELENFDSVHTLDKSRSGR